MLDGRPSPFSEGEAASEGYVRSRSLAIAERRALLTVVDLAILGVLAEVISRVSVGPGSLRYLIVPMVIAWLVVGQLSGIYDLDVASSPRRTVSSVLRTGIGAGILLILSFYLQPYIVSRPKLLELAVSAPAAVLLWRLAYARLLGGRNFERRILLVGAGVQGRVLLERIQNSAGHGIVVVGFVDDDPARAGTLVEGVRVLGTGAALWQRVVELGVEEVVLTETGPVSGELQHALGRCYEHNLLISLMPNLYEEVSGQVPVEHMEERWLGAVALGRAGGGIYSWAKRLLDIAGAAIVIVVLAPLMIVITILVKLSSQGPVFHRQTRLGLHRRSFQIVKFRSMRPAQPNQLESDEARITPVGRWLRRSHLDEIPQLFLVIRGDMSLVGPRPEQPSLAEDLEQSIPLYLARYAARPGITGWAQVHHRHAGSREETIQKLGYDLYYIKNRSMLLDITILVRTLARVLRLQGR